MFKDSEFQGQVSVYWRDDHLASLDLINKQILIQRLATRIRRDFTIKVRERHLMKPLIKKANHFKVCDVINFADVMYFFLRNFLEIDFVIKKKHKKTFMLMTFTFLMTSRTSKRRVFLSLVFRYCPYGNWIRT